VSPHQFGGADTEAKKVREGTLDKPYTLLRRRFTKSGSLGFFFTSANRAFMNGSEHRQPRPPGPHGSVQRNRFGSCVLLWSGPAGFSGTMDGDSAVCGCHCGKCRVSSGPCWSNERRVFSLLDGLGFGADTHSKNRLFWSVISEEKESKTYEKENQNFMP
jgi:hypothetical protein